MSDSRGGGPGNVIKPRVPSAAGLPGKPMTPRAPAVAPAAPAAPAAPRPPMPSTTGASITVNIPPGTPAAKKLPDEPDSGGWDASDADTVTSFPDPDDLPETPRNIPPVKGAVAAPPATHAPGTNVPPTPNSPGTVRGPYQTSPGIGVNDPSSSPKATGPAAGTKAPAGAAAQAVGLPSAMREEVWAIVRAAVEEAVSPLVAKQRELEARAERAERFAEAAKTAGKPIGAGIPAPAAPVIHVPTARTNVSTSPPAQHSIPVTAASLPPEELERETSQRTSRGPAAASLPPAGTYGVTVMPSTRPQLDLESVGAVDISGFDGGRRKKAVARAVVLILLAIVIGVVTMTLLSHSN